MPGEAGDAGIEQTSLHSAVTKFEDPDRNPITVAKYSLTFCNICLEPTQRPAGASPLSYAAYTNKHRLLTMSVMTAIHQIMRSKEQEQHATRHGNRPL